MQFGVRPAWFSNLNVWIKGPDPGWRPQGSPLHPHALVPGGSVAGLGPRNQCSGSVLTGNGSNQSLVGQKSLYLIKSDLPHLFFFHGDSFLCSTKSSVRSWSYFPTSNPRSCSWVQVSDPPYIHCRACDELDIKSYFSVGLSCCPRTICLRVFPLLTLSKICLGNKGGCVSRLRPSFCMCRGSCYCSFTERLQVTRQKLLTFLFRKSVLASPCLLYLYISFKSACPFLPPKSLLKVWEMSLNPKTLDKNMLKSVES